MLTTALAASGLVAALASPASAAPAGPNAVAADAVVLSGNATSRVTYGLPVVTKAAATAAPRYSTVALTSRTKAAPRAAATAAAVATVASRGAASTTAARTSTRTATPSFAPRGGVLGIAAGLSGIPYQWGGTSPAGFDCSGYVQYVFRQAGVSLPRTAGAQRAVATPVSNPVPGDLIFFGTWHVGIYAGNGMMYDAPTAGQTTGLHKIWSNAVSYGRVG